ncbi:hypothetical protein [Symbiopectobacterium sp. RP]|uniref:hypothetical protein n=1 Tax=Symbiopectobacterium sp. RP TaxID=3248553 RepID=UPI003D26AAAA
MNISKSGNYTISCTGSLLGTTLFAIGLFDININSDVFYSWVTQVLIPVLPKNSVIVMDNATFHKKHIFNKSSSMQGTWWSICLHIRQILTPLSINGHKQKKREWLRYRDFVLSPYGVIKIKSLCYTGRVRSCQMR